MPKCSCCAKQFRAGRTPKKSVKYKDGTKAKRISARKEFNAGAKKGTRYKTPRGWKTLSLDKRRRPYLSNSKAKRRASFSRPKRAKPASRRGSSGRRVYGRAYR